MSIPKFEKDLKIIQKLSDLPNSTEGLTADQLKAKFDEAALAIQQWLNEQFIPNLIAENIPFAATGEIDADNLADAITNVQAQVKDASTGAIVNGSVTTEKLSAALLARTYGGRPWVSMDTPGSAQGVAQDFPIGQIWLRPPFTVVNAATENWSCSGCSAEGDRHRLTVTGNGTVTATSATQLLSNIGNDGDRVFVFLTPQNRDSEMTALTVSLNGGAVEEASNGIFTANLIGGNLTVKITATWPTTSLAVGSYELENYTVVNIDSIVRQTQDAREIVNWATYLESLRPLDTYASPEEVFIQTINGTWWPMGKAVYPVSRGGTGVSALNPGDLLYGTEGDAMQKLSAGEDGAVLRVKDGVPAWATLNSLYADGSGLQLVSGSYTGNGAPRSISLGVEPVLFALCSQREESGMASNYHTYGKPVFFSNGGYECDTYDYTDGWGDVQRYRAYAKLNGGVLEFTGEAGHAPMYNADGVEYRWYALALVAE